MRTRQSSAPGNGVASATVVPLRPLMPEMPPQPGGFGNFGANSRPFETGSQLPPLPQPKLPPLFGPAPGAALPHSAGSLGTGSLFPRPPVSTASPRMPSAPMPPSPTPAAHIDPAVAHDVQLGQIFTNMRLAMKVSRETIARRLATSTFIIEAFETGTVLNLPHWRETARIVRGYCELLRLDPEPILWRIKSHYHASGLPLGLLAHDGSRPAEALPPVTDRVRSQQARPPVSPASRSGDVHTERRRRRRRGRLLVLSVPVLMAGLLALSAQRAPDPVYAVVSYLPQSVKAPLRNAFDTLVQTMAPMRDGLRWVELSDPQLRKSDKLQTRR